MTADIAPLKTDGQQPAADEFVPSSAMILNDHHFDRIVKFAQMMSEAAVSVPQHLRGKPGDCLAVAMQATQWGMNPFAVAQKTHFVNGQIGYEAQLVNAVVQQCGAIDGGFEYQYRGEGGSLECRVGAVLRGQRNVTWGEWLSISSVTTKNSPLWKTNPKQQMGYLQVKNWARLYTPGAILGVYTPDELIERDMGAAEVVEQPPKTIAGIAKARAAQRRAHGPSLDDVLAAIEESHDKASLSAAKALGAQMPEGPDKERAVEAYKARVAELKAQADQPDESGATISDALAAINAGDLDLARDIARSLDGDDRQQAEAAIHEIEMAAQA